MPLRVNDDGKLVVKPVTLGMVKTSNLVEMELVFDTPRHILSSIGRVSSPSQKTVTVENNDDDDDDAEEIGLFADVWIYSLGYEVAVYSLDDTSYISKYSLHPDSSVWANFAFVETCIDMGKLVMVPLSCKIAAENMCSSDKRIDMDVVKDTPGLVMTNAYIIPGGFVNIDGRMEMNIHDTTTTFMIIVLAVMVCAFYAISKRPLEKFATNKNDVTCIFMLVILLTTQYVSWKVNYDASSRVDPREWAPFIGSRFSSSFIFLHFAFNALAGPLLALAAVKFCPDQMALARAMVSTIVATIMLPAFLASSIRPSFALPVMILFVANYRAWLQSVYNIINNDRRDDNDVTDADMLGFGRYIRFLIRFVVLAVTSSVHILCMLISFQHLFIPALITESVLSLSTAYYICMILSIVVVRMCITRSKADSDVFKDDGSIKSSSGNGITVILVTIIFYSARVSKDSTINVTSITDIYQTMAYLVCITALTSIIKHISCVGAKNMPHLHAHFLFVYKLSELVYTFVFTMCIVIFAQIIPMNNSVWTSFDSHSIAFYGLAVVAIFLDTKSTYMWGFEPA